MPLSPGTALQNGQYVVDALLEAAPNGDLYWGTHVVTGMQVFIQVSPVGNGDGSAELSALVERLQGVAFSPQSPLPKPFQLVRGEDQPLCLAMGATVGLPWSLACQTRAPMSPKQALAAIRQVASGVTWLRENDVKDVDLAPNRVWIANDSDLMTLTGLPRTHLNLPQDSKGAVPDSATQALANLLYSFLLGELSASHDADFLKQNLQTKLPSLSPKITQAVYEGIQTDGPAGSLPLSQWLDLLPDSNTTHQISASEQLTLRSTPISPPPPKKLVSRFRLYPALGVTALTAAIAGVTLGTAWRLSAKSLPGIIQLDPEQSFPSQSGWQGDDPKVTFDEPFVPAQEDSTGREDWLDSDWQAPAPEETWESADPSDQIYSTYEDESDQIPAEEAGVWDAEETEAIDDYAEDNLPEDVPGEEFDQGFDELIEAPAPVSSQEMQPDFSEANSPVYQTPRKSEVKSMPSDENASQG